MEAVAVAVATKEWWGPRIWKILHSLAELSDRVDCMFLWKGVLRHTADILPCEACRTHFHQRVPMFHASVSFTREVVRERIREFLWSAHQDVNGRNAKPGIPKESLEAEYGVREGYTREDSIRMIGALVDEIVSRFVAENVLDRFRANIPILWKRDILTLLHSLQLPVPTSGPVSGGRRGRTRTGRRV